MDELIEKFLKEEYYPTPTEWKVVEAFYRVLNSCSTLNESQEESNLVAHAKRELIIAGLNEKDSDYGGMLYDAVMDLVKLFSSQGHSGFSANMALHLFDKVCRFKNLTPLTDDPQDWVQVSEKMPDKEPTWQCKRCSSCFSSDGGKTYHNIEDWIVHDDTGSYYSRPETLKLYTSSPHKQRVQES